MLQRDIAVGDVSALRPSVRLSVCPFVTVVLTPKLKRRIMQFTPSGNPWILGFLDQISYQRSQGTPLAMASNETGVAKNGENWKFSANKSLHLVSDRRCI